jgi:hypothetical protein
MEHKYTYPCNKKKKEGKENLGGENLKKKLCFLKKMKKKENKKEK